ncbi:nitrite reductase small subunit NirD [Microbacterium testaceum]|uniref:nitrite reductase small subunit NirD n=1 Tax=Microbacterium testaceum TaxID=2033 RepID=UPI000AE0EABB
MTIVDATTTEATRTDAMTPDATTPSATTAPAPDASEAAPAGSTAATSQPAGASTAGAGAAATTAPAPTSHASHWVAVCRVDDLLVERGAAALLGDRQIALFRTYDGRLYATDQIDPFSGAAIMSRGIVGDRAGVPTVASPMYKQVFDLRTGLCLDTQGKEPLSVRVHPVTVTDGVVFVKLAPAADAAGAGKDPR